MTARARTAKEVAAELPCSAWWIKEQARQGRIPYTWIGGQYCFTDAQVTEILAICEQRPDRRAGQPAPAAPRRLSGSTRTPDGTTAQLKARRPRRLRDAS